MFSVSFFLTEQVFQIDYLYRALGIVACSFLFSVTTFFYTFSPSLSPSLLLCAGGKHVVHRKNLSTQWEKANGKRRNDEEEEAVEEKNLKYLSTE